MSKKIKKVEDHLQIIEYLLAGILLKRELETKKVAKILGVRNKKLTSLYPKRKRKKKNHKVK